MNEDRDILDTKNMLEDGFFARLGKIKVSPKKVQEMKEAMENEGNEEIPSEPANYNTEKVLAELFEARDILIDSFSKIGITNQSQSMVEGINKIGSCINSMGGEAEKFDPFSHISGLQAPNLKKNAKRVIENTVESYTLGKIENINIEDEGKTIVLSFIGKQGSINYKAVGTLTALKKWNGNEAIDYVYTPSEGRMSVKEYSDNGKWIDKSSSYKISWELFEKESDFNVMPTEVNNIEESVDEEVVQNTVVNACKKNVEIKEEIQNNTQNNINNDSNIDYDEEIGDDIGDFPIEEK
jgi:hypothetical protein